MDQRRPRRDHGLRRNARLRGGCRVADNGKSLPANIRDLITAKVGHWLRHTGWHEQEREDLEQELVAEYLRRSAELDVETADSGAYASVMFDRVLASIRCRRRAKKRSGGRAYTL